jgi:diacylglycerol kinase (ATP)
MDHGAARRLADAIDVELCKDDDKSRPSIARRSDPLAHRGNQHSIEVCLGHRALAWGRRFRDNGERARVGVSQETDERRQYLGPPLALGHPFGRTKRREADGRGGARCKISAFDQRLQGAPEGAGRERQPLGRDRGKQLGRASLPRGEALEQIQAKERRRESGRGRTNRRSPSDGGDTKSDRNLRWPATCHVGVRYMGERALLIVNPAAGKRHAADGDLAECVRLLTAAGFEIDLRETSTEGPSSADLAKAAIAEGFRVVLVAGGDGTVAPAAIALLETDVTLGILPFGSYMNIANGLGIPLKPIDAARVIAGRKVKRSDVGKVAGKVFFETCGIGIDAEMFDAARLAERGRWRPALQRMLRWATANSHRVEITVDGKTERHRVLQILIVNSPYYGWALPIVPNADMTDGQLDVAIFPRKGRLELIGWMARIWHTGRPGKPPRVLRGKVIEIASSEPVPVHADGQIAGRLPVTARCCEGALRVFA